MGMSAPMSKQWPYMSNFSTPLFLELDRREAPFRKSRLSVRKTLRDFTT